MTTVENDRAIVESDETYRGSIRPAERAAIDRTVTIESGATVTGGVYGTDVTVERDAVVEGPVMASNSITLSDATVTADVGTPGKLQIDGGRIYGSVNGTRSQIQDCVILGNAVAEYLELTDSTVLGIAVGESELDLRASCCYTFKCFEKARIDESSILVPQAVADGRLELHSPVIVLPFDAERLPTDRLPAELVADGHLQLTRDQLHEQDGTTYLSLVPRLLDARPVEDRMDDVEAVLKEAVLAATRESDVAAEIDEAWIRSKLGVE